MDNLDLTDAPPRRSIRSSSITPKLVALLLVVGAGGTAFVLLRRQDAGQTPALPNDLAPVADVPIAPARLPSQQERDAMARDILKMLSNHPELARWLLGEDIVRRLVSATYAVAEGRRPKEQLEGVLPSGRFVVQEERAGMKVDPLSFAAYRVIADVLASIDANAAAQAFRKIEPLCDAIFAELAPRGATFRPILQKALTHLGATPVPAGELRVIAVRPYYTFAEPELERLSPAQKQLLRMGPDNARRIQTKLQEIGAALGTP